MKIYISALFGLFVVTTVFATIISEFRGWNELTDRSPDIIIAKCTATVGPDKPVVITNHGIPSEIEVLSVLKGNTKPGPAHMLSAYWPHQGEQFLLFGNYRNDSFFTGYNAVEEYRGVPLNRYFQTNILGGQTLDEKIQWVLQSRLRDLNEELEKAQQEKKRLEEGIKTNK